jgi:hypothetical protein
MKNIEPADAGGFLYGALFLISGWRPILCSALSLIIGWAHVRRKFIEALRTLPAAQKDQPVAASVGLDYFNRFICH